jgi:hypothetical protein
MRSSPPEYYLGCPKPEIWDMVTDDEWDKQDETAYNTAVNRCPAKYKESPCLIKFVRYKRGQYSVLCGHKRQLVKGRE